MLRRDASDDFDECHPLPYTNDLIRLAASVKIARELGLLSVKSKVACDIILEGYRQSLQDGAVPWFLPNLRHRSRSSESMRLSLLKDFGKSSMRIHLFAGRFHATPGIA